MVPGLGLLGAGPGPEQKEPKPGDLIQIFRSTYDHWAVYVGYGYVVHMAPQGQAAEAGFSSLFSVLTDKAVVRRDPLWIVTAADRYQVNNLHDTDMPARPREDIVRDAEAQVGQVLSYSITSQNCEHFVTQLRYGVPCSDQVRDAVTAGAAGVALLGVLGAGLFVGKMLLRSRKEEE
ncbi:phospholipase A and acyltransferase 3 isoform X1 [Alligator mississippiensis]|uniref:phospholipase A and acyltransferase 3 isoform X1 n=1 Tax=Alligator mississippiensis TaxID=8496 RepID=UPI000906FAE2|nr:phospholipase A and acyltransferase 3 isoform X1 [Alligator mississippiensis]